MQRNCSAPHVPEHSRSVLNMRTWYLHVISYRTLREFSEEHSNRWSR